MTREGITALTYLCHKALHGPREHEALLLTMAEDMAEVMGYSEDEFCAILGEVKFNETHVGSRL